ncbi:hypothetical protein OCU04_010386 [Sclerotinia nivalis]|uniref:Uncharacterized protein n=1 Tax=Sclerotinia nivalis TaxID=352851 RepID=A0A9X0DHU4_9HELO|nr:hypothetical protein OCU04_010386 [Sclerotinia nivalis]
MLTSAVHLIYLGDDVASPRLKDPRDEICAPFAFKFVHNTSIVKDSSTKSAHYGEPNDYVFLTEVTREKIVREKGGKDQIMRIQDRNTVRFHLSISRRPRRIPSGKLNGTEILGVLYTDDLKVSAKATFLQICAGIKMERSDLKVETKIPSPGQRILDPTEGWLYDCNRRDHILCCPKSGRPVFDKYGRFTWALDLKPKPKRTVSAPESVQKKQEKEKKPEKKQPSGSESTSIPRPVEGTRRAQTMK